MRKSGYFWKLVNEVFKKFHPFANLHHSAVLIISKDNFFGKCKLDLFAQLWYFFFHSLEFCVTTLLVNDYIVRFAPELMLLKLVPFTYTFPTTISLQTKITVACTDKIIIPRIAIMGQILHFSGIRGFEVQVQVWMDLYILAKFWHELFLPYTSAKMTTAMK